MAPTDTSPADGESVTVNERIRDLVEIDKDVTSILRSAGNAIKAIALLPKSSGTTDLDHQDLHANTSRAAFEQHTTDFFTLIQSVAARLRRQVYALEESGIIAAEAPVAELTAPEVYDKMKFIPGQPKHLRVDLLPMPITNEGLGNFDVGWLNSRASQVGNSKEAELWREARVLMGKLEQQHEQTGNEDAMDVDSTHDANLSYSST